MTSKPTATDRIEGYSHPEANNSPVASAYSMYAEGGEQPYVSTRAKSKYASYDAAFKEPSKDTMSPLLLESMGKPERKKFTKN